MRKDHSALKNRICHYAFLLLLLLGSSIGGLVSLNCTGSAANNAYTVQEAEGIEAGKDGGVVFTKDENEAPTAEVNIPETIKVNGMDLEVVWVCDTVWDEWDREWQTEEFTGAVTVYHVRRNYQAIKKTTVTCLSYEVEDTTRFAPISRLEIPVKYEPETG